MAEFETPQPISLIVDLLVGDVQINASERANTLVEVRPTDPSRRLDVTAAEHTRVDYADGELQIKTTRRWRQYARFDDGGSVDVRVDLPAGSELTGGAAIATVRTGGPLGKCRVKTSVGDIHVEQCATAELQTSAGNVDIRQVGGDAEISTSTGSVRVGDVGGAVVIKNSNGDTRVGAVTGDLRVKAANGDITIDRAHASVAAKSAKGEIRIGAVSRGPVVAETGMGEIEIGVPEGTAAWLDLHTNFGELRNVLDTSGPPAPGEDSVEVRARTGYGDITIRRAESPASSPVAAEGRS